MDYNTIQTVGGVALIAVFILPVLITLIFRNWEFVFPASMTVLGITLIVALVCVSISDSIKKRAGVSLRWKEKVVEIVEIGGPPEGYPVKIFTYEGYTVEYVKLTDNVVAVINGSE